MAAALAAFGASLAGSFHYDDYALFNDPAITSPSGWWEVWKPLSTRPLTYFTFWINYHIGGRDPFGYHAVNLGVHVIAVLLLWTALQRLTTNRVAFIAALLFAVHPIETEPVAYIFQRGTLLATAFCIAALVEWVRDRPWIAVAWFAGALLAKEECVAFPIFLLLVHLRQRRARRELAAIAAMIALALLAGIRVIFATAVTHGAGAGFGAGITPATYFSYQGEAILRYLGMIVVPWGFTVDPQIEPAVAPLRVLAWLAVAALACTCVWLFRRRSTAFWFLSSLVLLLPSSSIFPASDLAVDRRMYLPMIALAACLALLLDRVDRRIVAVIVIALIAISIRYSLVWRTDRSLWSEAVERAPEKVRPRIQLARTLDPKEALQQLQHAQQIAPDDPDIATEEGRIYLTAGMPGQALAAFGRALALSPNDPLALNNRGAALLALGQRDVARQDFERALARDPCLFDARSNLLRMGVRTPDHPQCRYTPEQRSELSQ